MVDIAIILPTLGGGGAEKVMVNLSSALAERGFKVDMVLGRAAGEFLPELDPRLRVVDLAAPRILQALPALARYLRREQPRTVLSSLPHLNLAVLLARRWSGSSSRLVIVEHGDVTLAAAHPIRSWERFFPAAMRSIYPLADAVVAVSQGVADGLVQHIGLPPEMVAVIHNPVNIDDILEKAAVPLDHPWYTSDEPPVIVSAGRLAYPKDQATLLQAFARLRVHHPARLILLGDGGQRRELELLATQLGIQKDVEFAGFQPNPFPFIAGAAVLALSSIREGFGNVLVEALVCGTQAVSTDCPGGPADILGHGSYGWLVPVGDADTLAEALDDALDHPLPVAVLRAHGRTFSVDVALEKYLQVLRLNE